MCRWLWYHGQILAPQLTPYVPMATAMAYGCGMIEDRSWGLGL